MKNGRYHHLGIPNHVQRDNEDYFAPGKMFHTNFDDNPYGIEWLRLQQIRSDDTEILFKLRTDCHREHRGHRVLLTHPTHLTHLFS